MSSDKEAARDYDRRHGSPRRQLQILEADLRYVPKWLAMQKRYAAKQIRMIRNKIAKLKARS